MIRTLRDAVDRLKTKLGAFAGNERGVSAVEFAMILPVMATMYLGTVEVTNAVSASRKVTAAASALGDLAAQATDIDNTEMTNLMNAARAVLQPFTTGPMQFRVSQIRIDDQRRVTVGWSDAQNMSAYARGAAFTGLPATLLVANTWLVYAEVSYGYTSPVGSFLITGTMTMRDDFYLRPRIGDCVRRNGACS